MRIISDTEAEKAARAYCSAIGDNPDQLVPTAGPGLTAGKTPLWRIYAARIKELFLLIQLCNEVIDNHEDDIFLAPGSREAIEAGCICPVIDNHHGRGYYNGVPDEKGNKMYIYREGCPVHA